MLFSNITSFASLLERQYIDVIELVQSQVVSIKTWNDYEWLLKSMACDSKFVATDIKVTSVQINARFIVHIP